MKTVKHFHPSNKMAVVYDNQYPGPWLNSHSPKKVYKSHSTSPPLSDF